MSDLDEKHEIIRRRDELFAFDLAKRIMEKPKASIWIIFMPVFFVFYAQRLQKYKGSVHGFVKHYLHTKTLALDAALEESKGHKPLDERSAQDLPSEDQAWKIREQQHQELDLLREHYLLLLRSSGKSYPELVRSGYSTSGAYRSFLNRLIKAEGAVNRAVLDVHHPGEEAQDVVHRMEQNAEDLREKEIQEIFSSKSSNDKKK
ncbi:MAG: NF038143 family protein, partial [Desulfovibrionales bacterium]